VAAFASAPFVLVVTADSRFKTFAELLTTAKSQPGTVTFASSGTGTMTHMVVELASVVGKANLLHIPYKGVVAAYADLYGGRVDLLADAPASTIAPVQAGKLRALAITGPRRLAGLPGVPTVAELGLAGAEAQFVTGLLAPAGTPPAVLARLESETLKVSRGAPFREFLAAQGYETLSATSQEFAASNRDELKKWSGVVRERNIKAD
jgi:tripartite-type tricarboxylate transporter receptor subunit TctC